MDEDALLCDTPLRRPTGPDRFRVAVVGHVEWTTIARVETVPLPGDVIHADPLWQGPAGGGAVAAVGLAELAGGCTFFTALGDDDAGHSSRTELERRGVRVLAAPRQGRTREAVSMVDGSGERTTVTLGERLEPAGGDALDWRELAGFDAVFFTAGDTAVLRAARQAAVLVVTSRELATVSRSGVVVDAMVGSAHDPAERYDHTLLAEPPELLVSTEGVRGGRFVRRGEPARRYPAIEAPGPVVDTYGVGDNFAAALTFALGSGSRTWEALEFAARRSASCVARRGPFEATALAGAGQRGAGT
ncbi:MULTISPECIES: PfkB family carbohydrate kinase [Kitasatospora]|uniref:PfkB family carbohydrate kinase n=1 Tax=Kitasatospora cystarginea TaxID=58350 RepID=A0ABN3EQ07_9ACTN